MDNRPRAVDDSAIRSRGFGALLIIRISSDKDLAKTATVSGLQAAAGGILLCFA